MLFIKTPMYLFDFYVFKFDYQYYMWCVKHAL